MSKFKSGDKVYWEFEGEKHYREVSHMDHEGCVYFTSGFWMPEVDVYFVDENLDLPEVPRASRYECDIHPGRDYISLDAETNKATILINTKQAHDNCIVALSPETALELSADLLRMALEMKRKLDA